MLVFPKSQIAIGKEDSLPLEPQELFLALGEESLGETQPAQGKAETRVTEKQSSNDFIGTPGIRCASSSLQLYEAINVLIFCLNWISCHLTPKKT